MTVFVVSTRCRFVLVDAPDEVAARRFAISTLHDMLSNSGPGSSNRMISMDALTVRPASSREIEGGCWDRDDTKRIHSCSSSLNTNMSVRNSSQPTTANDSTNKFEGATDVTASAQRRVLTSVTEMR